MMGQNKISRIMRPSARPVDEVFNRRCRQRHRNTAVEAFIAVTGLKKATHRLTLLRAQWLNDSTARVERIPLAPIAL